MWIKDPKTKEKSVTLTAFAVGFGVAVLKLALSGLSIGDFKAEPFSGTDFAAVVGALGAIYTARRNVHVGSSGSDGKTS